VRLLWVGAGPTSCPSLARETEDRETEEGDMRSVGLLRRINMDETMLSLYRQEKKTKCWFYLPIEESKTGGKPSETYSEATDQSSATMFTRN